MGDRLHIHDRANVLSDCTCISASGSCRSNSHGIGHRCPMLVSLTTRAIARRELQTTGTRGTFDTGRCVTRGTSSVMTLKRHPAEFGTQSLSNYGMRNMFDFGSLLISKYLYLLTERDICITQMGYSTSRKYPAVVRRAILKCSVCRKR